RPSVPPVGREPAGIPFRRTRRERRSSCPLAGAPRRTAKTAPAQPDRTRPPPPASNRRLRESVHLCTLTRHGSTTSRATSRNVRKASGHRWTSGGAVVAIGSRKRRRDEPVGIPTAEDAQREAVIARLFDGVLRSARSQLLRADSPLAVEVWGSGLLAV